MHHGPKPTARAGVKKFALTARDGAARLRPVIARSTSRRRLSAATKLHLGSGDNVLSGWANLDLLGGNGVLSLDLTKPLPVDSNSIDFIFTEHFIEHITRAQGAGLLADCYRVLRPGGVIRISTPSLRKLVSEYTSGRVEEWGDVEWLPSTPCQMVNEGVRDWGHQFVYDHEEMHLLLKEVGFRQIVDRDWRRSGHSQLENLECRPHHDEVIVEATK